MRLLFPHWSSFPHKQFCSYKIPQVKLCYAVPVVGFSLWLHIEIIYTKTSTLICNIHNFSVTSHVRILFKTVTVCLIQKHASAMPQKFICMIYVMKNHGEASLMLCVHTFSRGTLCLTSNSSTEDLPSDILGATSESSHKYFLSLVSIFNIIQNGTKCLKAFLFLWSVVILTKCSELHPDPLDGNPSTYGIIGISAYCWNTPLCLAVGYHLTIPCKNTGISIPSQEPSCCVRSIAYLAKVQASIRSDLKEWKLSYSPLIRGKTSGTSSMLSAIHR